MKKNSTNSLILIKHTKIFLKTYIMFQKYLNKYLYEMIRLTYFKILKNALYHYYKKAPNITSYYIDH